MELFRDTGIWLDRIADRAQDRADLATQEDEGDDGDDRDEGQDQRVLGQALTLGSAGLPEGAQVVDDNAHFAIPFQLQCGIPGRTPPYRATAASRATSLTGSNAMGL